MESNSSFVCALCGQRDNPPPIDEGVNSYLVLTVGYGSIYDMEKVTVPLCGDCADKLFPELAKLPGAKMESPWYK